MAMDSVAGLMERTEALARLAAQRNEAARAWAREAGPEGLCPPRPEQCEGVVTVPLEVIEPSATGELAISCPFEEEDVCPHKGDRRRQSAQRRLRALGFSERALTPTWQRVPEDIRRPLQVYSRSIGTRIERGEGLIIGGDTGAGKTCALALLAVAARGWTTEYWTAHGLYRLLERRFEREGEAAVLEECALLLIDDLGTEAVTARAAAELHDVMDRRTGDRRSTVVTTNVTAEELRERRPDLARMFSRLEELSPWLQTAATTQRTRADWRTWEVEEHE